MLRRACFAAVAIALGVLALELAVRIATYASPVLAALASERSSLALPTRSSASAGIPGTRTTTPQAGAPEPERTTRR